MKPLYTKKDFDLVKSKDKLPLQCYCCNKIFFKTKRKIYDCINPNERLQGKFCSKKCQNKFQDKKKIVTCKNCNNTFNKSQAELKKSPNHFCSRSCAAIYNNSHKKHGTRRSKLEKYIEECLSLLYPKLHIDYNKTNAINAELDIYIPSLQLAFELNGIFHYEPIYGSEKLNKMKNNDQRKFQACIEKSISLCIMDTSKQKYFKESTSNEFVNIISNIIKQKLNDI